jgi:hypothetical protein
MNPIRRAAAAAAVAALCSCLLPGWIRPLAAQSSTVVRIDPLELALQAGETAAVSIHVEGASNLYGVEIHLSFDPAIVQIVDADADEPGVQTEPGDLMSIDQGFLVANRVDNTTGKLLFGLTLLNPAPPVSGDGILLAFELEALAAGTSDLVLSPVILASPQGEELPSSVEHGRVTVGGAEANATPVPSNTPAPLATPTAETGVSGLLPIAGVLGFAGLVILALFVWQKRQT